MFLSLDNLGLVSNFLRCHVPPQQRTQKQSVMIGHGGIFEFPAPEKYLKLFFYLKLRHTQYKVYAIHSYVNERKLITAITKNVFGQDNLNLK